MKTLFLHFFRVLVCGYVIGQFLLPQSCVFAGGNALIELTPDEQRWLDEHPVVRLAPPPNYPPLDFFDENGKNVGITADYIEIIQKNLGRHFIEVVRCKHWEELVHRFKQGEIDLVGSVMKTPRRQEHVLFTKNFYIEEKGIIVTRHDVKGGMAIKDLKGMQVVVASCYATAEYLEDNYPYLELVYVPDILTGLREVSFGLADALIGTVPNVTYFIEQDGITNLKISGELDLPVTMSFACRKDYPELVSIIEKGLDSITPEQKKAIYRKWVTVGDMPFYATKRFIFLLRVISLLILSVIIVILGWSMVLKRQVEKRTRELKAKNTELEKANLELDSFVYAASHDLLSPVITIHSYIDMICPEGSTKYDKETLRYMERVKSAAKTMETLIHDLLALSRISRINNPFEIVDVPALIESLKPRIPEFEFDNVELNIQAIIPPVTCDRFKIGELFVNLLGNAIKFSFKERADKVRIDIGYAEKNDHHEFYVKDYGIGIAAEYQEKIFRYFFKLHSAAEYPGSGLGLSLAQKIVEAHQGRLWVESEQGKGATFFFTISKKLYIQT
ncbi:MAG: transporter substrate-binding domain-containing protein [Candidatus Auribacterota bacterium]